MADCAITARASLFTPRASFCGDHRAYPYPGSALGAVSSKRVRVIQAQYLSGRARMRLIRPLPVSSSCCPMQERKETNQRRIRPRRVDVNTICDWSSAKDKLAPGCANHGKREARNGNDA